MRADIWGKDLDLIFDNETEIGILAERGFKLNLDSEGTNLEIILLCHHNARFPDGVLLDSEKKSPNTTEIQVTLDHLAYLHLIGEAETPRYLSKRADIYLVNRVSIYTPRAYETILTQTLN